MSLKIEIRRTLTLVDHKQAPASESDQTPLRRVAAVLVVANPHAGKYVEDLKPTIAASVELGRQLAQLAVQAMGDFPVQSYGKGALVGLGGEQEHAAAMLTSDFAEPLRTAIGGGKAWISSFVKIGAPGTTVDIPLAHKDALYVRSHYDGISVMVPEGPQHDEIALIVTLANRGRFHARVGGLNVKDIKGQDGLY